MTLRAADEEGESYRMAAENSRTAWPLPATTLRIPGIVPGGDLRYERALHRMLQNRFRRADRFVLSVWELTGTRHRSFRTSVRAIAERYRGTAAVASLSARSRSRPAICARRVVVGQGEKSPVVRHRRVKRSKWPIVIVHARGGPTWW
jgi:hypothetical protein